MSATDTTTEAAAESTQQAPAATSNDLMIEVDGKLVPNYDATIKPFDEGDVVSGEVVRIDKDEVLVDIGYKSEGVIPSTELSIRRSVDPAEEVSLGERVDALVGFRSPRPSGNGSRPIPRLQLKVEVALEFGSSPMGTIDDRGRLFLCESSGNTLTTAQMAAKPDYHIRMLEDTNGDGVYDRSTDLRGPAYAARRRGVVSRQPLCRGAARSAPLRRHGWRRRGRPARSDRSPAGTSRANAASLHGPFFGPDGWLYLTDGRHGFDITPGKARPTRAWRSRIWRVRPDGSGLEWIAGGGFDNPVELIFQPTGETIGTMTYFQDPRDGQRDALLHYV